MRHAEYSQKGLFVHIISRSIPIFCAYQNAIFFHVIHNLSQSADNPYHQQSHIIHQSQAVSFLIALCIFCQNPAYLRFWC